MKAVKPIHKPTTPTNPFAPVPVIGPMPRAKHGPLLWNNVSWDVSELGQAQIAAAAHRAALQGSKPQAAPTKMKALDGTVYELSAPEAANLGLAYYDWHNYWSYPDYFPYGYGDYGYCYGYGY